MNNIDVICHHVPRELVRKVALMQLGLTACEVENGVRLIADSSPRGAAAVAQALRLLYPDPGGTIYAAGGENPPIPFPRTLGFIKPRRLKAA